MGQMAVPLILQVFNATSVVFIVSLLAKIWELKPITRVVIPMLTWFVLGFVLDMMSGHKLKFAQKIHGHPNHASRVFRFQ